MAASRRVVLVASITAVAVLLAAAGWWLAHRSGAGAAVRFRDDVAASDRLGARVTATNTGDTTVRFEPATGTPVTTTPAYADRIGTPVDITPSRALTGAVVRLAFDPERDLPPPDPGAPRATVANAYVAVWNPMAGTWLPLETTYDPDRHELVATAAHFSVFGTFSVKPHKITVPNPLAVVDAAGNALSDVGARMARGFDVIADTTTSGLQAFWNWGAGGLTEYLRALRDDATGTYPDDKHADCKNASPGWTATVTGSDQIKACLVDEDGKRWLRLENHRAYPVQLVPARGFTDVGWNPYDTAMIDDPLFVLQRAGTIPIQNSLGAGLRATELRVPTGKPAFTVTVQSSGLSVAIDLVMALLSFLPGVAEARGVLITTMRTEVVGMGAALREPTAVPAVISKVTKNPRTTLAPGRVQTATVLTDLYTCLAQIGNGITEHDATALLDIVRKCGATAADAYGKEMLSSIFGVLANVKVIAETKALFLHGLERATVQVNPPRPEQPQVNGLQGKNYAFLTNVNPGGGTITFDAIEWFEGADAVRACKADGKRTDLSQELCHDYYYRNNNDLLRIMEVDPAAPITYLDGQGVARQGTLTDLAAAADYPAELVIENDRILSVRQIFTP